MCLFVDMPEEYAVIGYEAVWGDGVTANVEQPPHHLHHQDLFICPYRAQIDSGLLDGHPFECPGAQMPGCDTQFAIAKTGAPLVTPSGVYLPIEKALQLLVVHYDNPGHAPIVNDTGGMRFWVAPEPTPPAGCTSNLKHRITASNAEPHILHPAPFEMLRY